MEIGDPTHWVYKDNTHDSAKHESERAKNGFSVYDWINFSDYLAWVIVQALKKFRDEGAGFPAILGNDTNTGMDEWKSILNEMITGFEAHLAMESSSHLDYASWDDYLEGIKHQHALRDRALDLFKEYYGNLWD